MSNEMIEQYLKRHHCRDYFNAYGDLVQDDHYFLYREEIDELIELIRNAEREACAQVCEELRDSFLSPQYATGQPMSSIRERFAAGRCAEAIRARGE